MSNSSHILIGNYLNLLKIRIDPLRIHSLYCNHPLPHSIRSVSDTLDELRIPNMVCRLEFEQLFEIEGPFIAVAGREEYPFYIVEELARESKTITMLGGNGKRSQLTFDQFKSVWDGAVLLAEKGEDTKEEPRPLYWLKNFMWHIDRTAKYWIGILAAFLLILGAMQTPELIDLRYLIKTVGVAVSLLVIVKSSFDPRLAEKFCRYGKRSDCNEVFKSAGAKLFGWVSLGELSLAYFVSSMLWGIFFAGNSNALFLFTDTLALLFVVYSLAWQLRNRKRCMLCLAIDAVLAADILGEALVWGNFGEMRFIALYPDLIIFAILFGLCLLSLRTIIRTAEQNRLLPQLKFKHELLLSSPHTFWMLLDRQPEAAEGSSTAYPVSNYLEAEHTVTVVMNPSCSKCARVHQLIASLEGYTINLLFVVNEGDRKSHDAALRMISSGITGTWDITERIIAGWYERYELPPDLAIHPQAEADLQAQMDYCRRIGITGTPAVLIDNKKLPEIYDIEDLKVLL